MVNDKKFGKRHKTFKKNNECPHVLSCGGYDLLEKKLLEEKRKKRQHEALWIENPPFDLKDLPCVVCSCNESYKKHDIYIHEMS